MAKIDQAKMQAARAAARERKNREHAIEADKAVTAARENCEGNRHSYGKAKRLTLTGVSASGKVAYFTFAKPAQCVKCDFVAPKGTRWSETVRPGLVKAFPAIAG